MPQTKKNLYGFELTNIQWLYTAAKSGILS